jgi:hypothetical protein
MMLVNYFTRFQIRAIVVDAITFALARVLVTLPALYWPAPIVFPFRPDP